ncbi:serine/threonine-protein kinase, partial [Mycolicibacterium insubricum]|uniref:serine/threonine-protein kinase n=1 Tax=Mycolicibacterium insubricum TaxID=444597 RepID=UPI0021F26A44
MGSVFLARHPTLPRSDALKVLSAEFSRDEQFRTRFIREADVAATLDHPNIVRVYTRGQTDDGQLWIAMQYVEGTDADAALRAGTMTPARAIHVVTGVAKALDYAHSRNVLHRDVKPANFLLAGEPGPRERVLLADFGIARALDEANRLTATGSVMVTIAYASPESIEGRAVDYRSDLYSLGCSLYRLLTGRAPFATAGSTTEVMLAHVNTPPPRVTEVMPNLPPAIDAVVARAMAKDPAQRYGSARELAEAAAAAFGMTAPTGPTVSSPVHLGTRAHRRRP